jgi:alpha-beta hydrolase superfamily lysophospholipase
MEVSTLLMHGTGDRLTSWKASKEFVDNANENVELQLFDGAYHELHNEINKREVLDAMIAWINKELKSTE